MKLKEIKEIVEKVRNDFEQQNIDYNLLGRLYNEYEPMKGLDSFINTSRKIFPHLNCGLTTVYLKSILKQGEIVNGKYENQNHTFLKIEDLIIDITADQFNGSKVYVGKMKKPWS